MSDTHRIVLTISDEESKRLAGIRETAFNAGHFELIGPTGHIMPRFWEHLIQPGWEIEFLFRGGFKSLNKSKRIKDIFVQEDKIVKQTLKLFEQQPEQRQNIWTKFSFCRRR